MLRRDDGTYRGQDKPVVLAGVDQTVGELQQRDLAVGAAGRQQRTRLLHTQSLQGAVSYLPNQFTRSNGVLPLLSVRSLHVRSVGTLHSHRQVIDQESRTDARHKPGESAPRQARQPILLPI